MGSLAVLAGIVTWWVGPNLVNLAVVDAQRDQPFTLFDFVRGPPAEVFAARYQRPMVGLMASEGGALVDDYRLEHLITGKRRDDWPYLTRLHMPRAADLVRVLTSSPYHVMVDLAPEFATLQVGSYAVPHPDWRPALVVWLVRNAQRNAGTDPLDPVLDILSRGDGRLVWDTRVTIMSNDEHWQRIAVLDFPSVSAAMGWLRHSEVKTARAIANSRSSDLSLAVYRREQGFD